MGYKASSVIVAVLKCGKLTVDKGTHKPSCPKKGNNINCQKNFPLCAGQNKKCQQKLTVVNESGNLSILYFDYYLSQNDRDGRIKKQNSALQLLVHKYNIDEATMISA